MKFNIIDDETNIKKNYQNILIYSQYNILNYFIKYINVNYENFEIYVNIKNKLYYGITNEKIKIDLSENVFDFRKYSYNDKNLLEHDLYNILLKSEFNQSKVKYMCNFYENNLNLFGIKEWKLQ